MIHIGDNIRIARKRRGFTQEELASQIGVTAQAVSRWESGAGMPDITMIVPIAQILSVSADMLFGLDDEEKDDQLYIAITNQYTTIDKSGLKPAENALEKSRYIEKLLEKNPANYVILTCLVERAADLSRYVDFDRFECDWSIRKTKAIQAGMQVLRFCNQREWVERTHFGLAWIYIHGKDYTSAREHIEQLPSIKANRLQESLLAQLASFESGVEGMKKVVNENLQHFVRAINKELLYTIEDLSWNADPKEAISFSIWSIKLMNQFSEKPDLLPYCRGFFRDIYKYLLHADLREKDVKLAKQHFSELKEGMQKHYDFYRVVLADEYQMTKYSERQLNYMRMYTQDFIKEKQNNMISQLKEWHEEELVEQMLS